MAAVEPRQSNHKIRSMILVAVLVVACFSLLSIGEFFQRCGAPLTIVRCGSNLVTIAAGSNFGTTTVPFSPVFTSPPTVTLGPIIFSGADTVILPTGGVTFLAVESVGSVWLNMPSAQTELFGDTTHEVQWVSSNPSLASVVSASFSVTCNIGSFGAAPVLRPMYSPDSGATWIAVSSTTTGLDVPVSAGCATGFVNNYAVQDTIASGLKLISTPIFRVDGIGGGDAGDAPSFVHISLQFYSNVFVRPTCTLSSSPTASGMVLRADISALLTVSRSVTCTWVARL